MCEMFDMYDGTLGLFDGPTKLSDLNGIENVDYG